MALLGIVVGKRKPVMKVVELQLEAGDLEWLEGHAKQRGITVERYFQRLLLLARRQDERRKASIENYERSEDAAV